MKRSLAALMVAAALAACGGGSTPPSVDATNVLRAGAASMAKLKTLTATLRMTKGTVSLQGFALVKAQTAVRLPTDSDTTYTVKEQDVTLGIEVVITAGHVYLRLPLLPFQEVSGSQAASFPDMARLFDTTTGLPAVIPAGSSPRYVSTDQLTGQSDYQVATTYTPAQIKGLLSQLNSSGPVAAHVWVGTADHQIHKAVLEGAFGDGGKDAAVEVDIASFDGAVTITSPTP